MIIVTLIINRYICYNRKQKIMDLSELSKCPVFGEEFINDGFSSLEGIKFKTKLYNKGEEIGRAHV